MRQISDLIQKDKIVDEILREGTHLFQVDSHHQEQIDTSHHDMVQAAVVHRQGDDGKTYMTTHHVHGIIYPQATFNFLQMLQTRFILAREVSVAASLQAYPEVSIRAHWYQASERTEMNVSADANVFGSLGVLEILDEHSVVEFPVIPAEKAPGLLAEYHAKLFRIDDDKSYGSAGVVLYATEYEFREGYVENYVLNPEKGGGLFVETHDFPHYFVPLAQGCSGGLILGVQVGAEEYKFATFKIPYGYGLEIDPSVIHGDSFFVGPYAITLTAAVEADSVLLRKQDGAIQPVAQRIVDVTEKEADDLPRLDRGEVQSALMAASRSGLTTFPAVEAKSSPVATRGLAAGVLLVER